MRPPPHLSEFPGKPEAQPRWPEAEAPTTAFCLRTIPQSAFFSAPGKLPSRRGRLFLESFSFFFKTGGTGEESTLRSPTGFLDGNRGPPGGAVNVPPAPFFKGTWDQFQRRNR